MSYVFIQTLQKVNSNIK